MSERAPDTAPPTEPRPVTATAAPSLVELTLRDLLAAVDEAFKAVPCCCDAAYYDRRLIAPECRHHDLADEFLSTYPCRCAACKRTESWRPDVT